MVFSDGRTKICITKQQSLVRVVLQDAIENVLSLLVSIHAFPDPDAAIEFTRTALKDAAEARLPGAVAIFNRLLADEEYFLNMSVIVSIS
jgi:hypothetical protein